MFDLKVLTVDLDLVNLDNFTLQNTKLKTPTLIGYQRKPEIILELLKPVSSNLETLDVRGVCMSVKHQLFLSERLHVAKKNICSIRQRINAC